jgi:DNA modification methylase
MGCDTKLKIQSLSTEKFRTNMTKISTSDLLLIRLPNLDKEEIKINSKNVSRSKLYKICQISRHLSTISEKPKDIVFLGSLHLLPYIYSVIDKKFQFKELIAIKLVEANRNNSFLPNEHMGLIIFSYKRDSFNEVRTPYQYCKCCKRTVKDYGGKTHLLRKDGTRISDVWKDITVNVNDIFPEKVISRIKELLAPIKKIIIISLMDEEYHKFVPEEFDDELLNKICPQTPPIQSIKGTTRENILINGNVSEVFKKIPDNTVDLALVDPPYNLAIRYGKFTDNMGEEDYLRWCKSWLDQIFRTLKKDGILTLVNIPKWSLELFPYLQQRMNFQGWIVWDAWGYPSKKIIPAHYPILCFSKGSKINAFNFNPFSEFKGETELDDIFYPLNYGYCIRDSCKNKRTTKMKNDRRDLSDLWTDLHRIRHNSFRYNHPTLMPQRLAKRIISVLTKPEDVVLDCFNGVGTTTLVAGKLDRKYIGIEINRSYYETSLSRHRLLSEGKDPFEKTRAKSTSKSKWYHLVKHQKYEIPKKALQLDVKNIAAKLGHCPTKTELRKHRKYPIKYYYDNFRDWAEITVATRRTGLQHK